MGNICVYFTFNRLGQFFFKYMMLKTSHISQAFCYCGITISTMWSNEVIKQKHHIVTTNNICFYCKQYTRVTLNTMQSNHVSLPWYCSYVVVVMF